MFILNLFYPDIGSMFFNQSLNKSFKVSLNSLSRSSSS